MQDLISMNFRGFILVFERHLKGNSAAKYEKKIIIEGGPPRKQLLSPHLLKAWRLFNRQFFLQLVEIPCKIQEEH